MKKITEEHFQEIQKLRENLLEVIYSIGELHLNKLMLKKQIDEIDSVVLTLENKFAEFQKDEMVLYKTLEETYGSNSINLDTGEIVE
jgi:hypothetical protein